MESTVAPGSDIQNRMSTSKCRNFPALHLPRSKISQAVYKYMNSLRPRANMDQTSSSAQKSHLHSWCIHPRKFWNRGSGLRAYDVWSNSEFTMTVNLLLSVKCHYYSKYHRSSLREIIEDHFSQLISVKAENKYKLVQGKLTSIAMQRKQIVTKMGRLRFLNCQHSVNAF